MEIKRMPRSQFLKLTVENKFKRKHKQTRDCLIDIMYIMYISKLMKNLLCVVIRKILLLGLIFFFYQPHCFLREFPVALGFSFKINLNGQNHLCTDGT